MGLDMQRLVMHLVCTPEVRVRLDMQRLVMHLVCTPEVRVRLDMQRLVMHLVCTPEVRYMYWSDGSIQITAPHGAGCSRLPATVRLAWAC